MLTLHIVPVAKQWGTWTRAALVSRQSLPGNSGIASSIGLKVKGTQELERVKAHILENVCCFTPVAGSLPIALGKLELGSCIPKCPAIPLQVSASPTFGPWRGSSSETGQAPASQQAFRLLAQLGAEAGGEKR